ncbi:HCNGP-like protein-domain-containing protein [Mycena sp. CBHHK59/15]|nr:HCNGP-like protein-domain-containing protein [Mycena sp. CBHHK59/15]
MHGLVAYDDGDSASDVEDSPRKPHGNGHSTHDIKQSKTSALNAFADSTRKAQVIIRRPAAPLKNRPRTVIADEVLAKDAVPAPASPTRQQQQNAEASSSSSSSVRDPQDELTRIRELLRPPPIPGVADWGIPPGSTEPCDPAIQTKLAQFHALKSAPAPRHFNDSLMGSRAFRNPHLYAQLVEFVDINERASNFPGGVWAGMAGGANASSGAADPTEPEAAWFADAIGTSAFMPLPPGFHAPPPSRAFTRFSAAPR